MGIGLRSDPGQEGATRRVTPRCSGCRYSLATLGETGACPECGRKYDVDAPVGDVLAVYSEPPVIWRFALLVWLPVWFPLLGWALVTWVGVVWRRGDFVFLAAIALTSLYFLISVNYVFATPYYFWRWYTTTYRPYLRDGWSGYRIRFTVLITLAWWLIYVSTAAFWWVQLYRGVSGAFF